MATIRGPAGTAYEGLNYKLSLKFPSVRLASCVCGCLAMQRLGRRTARMHHHLAAPEASLPSTCEYAVPASGPSVVGLWLGRFWRTLL